MEAKLPPDNKRISLTEPIETSEISLAIADTSVLTRQEVKKQSQKLIDRRQPKKIGQRSKRKR